MDYEKAYKELRKRVVLRLCAEPNISCPEELSIPFKYPECDEGDTPGIYGLCWQEAFGIFEKEFTSQK